MEFLTKESIAPALSIQNREITYLTGIEAHPTEKASFPFLVVNSPEAWEEAKKFHYSYDMPILGSQEKIKFKMRGVSLAEWDEVEQSIHVPEWDGEPGTETEEFETTRKRAVSYREVILFEKALGKEIPGVSYDEKIAFLAKRCPGETMALFMYIQDKVCGWNDAEQLIPEYNAVTSKATENTTKEFSSFEDWKEAGDSKYFFRMQRIGNPYIIEFPLRGIGKDVKEKIERETKEPPAPKVPVFRRGGMDRTAEPKPNRQDPAWLKMVRAISQKETVLLLEAALPFEIPGANEHEKYQWLGKRMVGDIGRLKHYIQSEMLQYTSRYNFFMNGQDQNA